MKKKMSMILTLVLMAAVLVPFPSVRAEAASTDVTKEMAGNQKIKKLSKLTAAYTTAMNLSAASTTKKVKMKLDDSEKLSFAVFVRYNYKDDYSYTASELRKETKNLFGKAASTGIIKKGEAAGTMFVCNADKTYTNDPYTYCGGEFGDTLPKYKIKKVVKTGKGAYTITIQNRIGVYGEKGSTNIGTTTLKIKKKASSKYGYTIKAISYKYNGK